MTSSEQYKWQKNPVDEREIGREPEPVETPPETPKKSKKGVVIGIIAALVVIGVAAALYFGGGTELFKGGDSEDEYEIYVTSINSDWQVLEGGEKQYLYDVETKITPDEWADLSKEDKEVIALSIGDNEVTADESADKYQVIGKDTEGSLIFMIDAIGNPYVY